MGRINSWLERGGARIAQVDPGRVLPFIVEAESELALPDVRQGLLSLGLEADARAVGPFLRVEAPFGTLADIANLLGVRVVSYDAPVWIRQAPTIVDPLLGPISLSPTTIPTGVLFNMALTPLKLPLLVPAAVGQALALVGLPGVASLPGLPPLHAPNLVIYPTGETREWIEAPEDNKIDIPVAVIDTGTSWPHMLLPAFPPPQLYSTTGEPPLDGLGHGCVDPDAKVFTTFCGLARIEDMWERVPGPIQKTNVGDTKFPTEPIFTLGLRDGKTVLSRVTAVHRIPIKAHKYSHVGNYVKRIKTRLGETLVTPWHPMFIRSPGDTNTSDDRFWKNRGKSQVIDKIEARYVQARRTLASPSLALGLLSKWSFKLFSGEMCYLAGLMKGDGCFVKGRGGWYRMRIFDQDLPFLERVKELVERLGPSVWRHRQGTTNCWVLGFDSKKLYEALPLISRELLSKDIGAFSAYLAGFFDAEGHVDPDRGRVRITNKDKDLLDWFRDVLAAIGIPTSLHEIHDTEGHNCWQLYIDPRFIPDFLALVKPHVLHLDKMERMEKAHTPLKQRRPYYRFEGANFIQVEETSQEAYDGYFYDFTTETGNYVANGVFVSNTWCITAAFGTAFNTRFGLCRGVAQANPANLISVKALSNIGFGTSFGILWALDLAIQRGARVLSLSLGGELQGSVTEDPACRFIELNQQGPNPAIFVIASGNSGPDPYSIGSPGASPFAVTVGAWSTHYDSLAIFSSRGWSGAFYRDNPTIWQADLATYGDRLIKPDCVAPGGGPGSVYVAPVGAIPLPVDIAAGDIQDHIYSGVVGWMDGINDLTPGDLLDSMRGSSMSCPAAAGLIAWCVDRGILSSAQEVKARLAATVQDAPNLKWGWTGGKDPRVGYGLITRSRLGG